MTLPAPTIAALANRLEQAELDATPISMITADHTEMDLADAYAIRAAKAARGANVSGLKMGLTSAAKIRQMGVAEPIYGFLNANHQFHSGAEISTAHLIHPRVEAEIGFVLKHPLRGPDCQIEDVLAATAYIVAAVEVIDSRYRDFRFDVRSVIADNTSAARYVVGEHRVGVAGVDLQQLHISLHKNGVVAAVGSGADVLGHPAASVAMLANMLGARGKYIPADVLIMTGGATEALPVSAGDHITVDYELLGSVSMLKGKSLLEKWSGAAFNVGFERILMLDKEEQALRAGTFVPPLFTHNLENLQERSGHAFLRQWSFEYKVLSERSGGKGDLPLQVRYEAADAGAHGGSR
jgi:2-oxo-3-hexenedioate decarboxylase